ncbi:uncharacterized protein BCR38DRAFT_489105 [Pseudomassariella vexata]|uniref:Uncharacterized protein n=1 Tax=Pseudomassariella vexata TaxID=1141098 RepID=A0A1Y2DHZ5_9PEZI|nr:uncharacterized protein BCR38DRAFT_489105 [Pseudomassariella vexata]ORY58746.1 hypothetical protein BCR38DRAFT_489105 [Pseudomassariella vexata]
MLSNSRFLLQLGSLAAAAAAAGPTLFQGNSVIITPSSSQYPSDATFKTSNFYCYASEKGYLSFGWWLPAEPGRMNHTHCKPRSDSYDWYEYSIAGDCTLTECRVTAMNYRASDQDKPAFQEHYIARMLDVGDGTLGDLALSYFDRRDGAFAVGTRRVLGGVGASASEKETRACNDAFQTLSELQVERKLSLSFMLENPCEVVSESEPLSAEL